jgi:hypothetical protein
MEPSARDLKSRQSHIDLRFRKRAIQRGLFLRVDECCYPRLEFSLNLVDQMRGFSALGTSRIRRMISVSSPERPSTRTRTASTWSAEASSLNSASDRDRISSSCCLILTAPRSTPDALRANPGLKEKTMWDSTWSFAARR